MQKTKVRFDNLDGIRGVAFLMVFIWHIYSYLDFKPSTFIETLFFNGLANKGHLGVNLFFVLSGFLITYLLLVEKENFKKINVLFFYVRRALRIWPLYFFVLIICFFVFPLLTNQYNKADVQTHGLYYLFFMSNFDRITSDFVGVGNDTLGTFWSIAVEEQFYLFWPVILAFTRKTFYTLIFYSLILFSLCFRYLHLEEPSVLYAHTLSVMSDLSVGGILAYSALYKTKLFLLLENCRRYFIILIYLILLLLIIFYHQWSTHTAFLNISERLILSIFFAFVIGEQCYSKHSFYKFHKLKFLSKLGIISFGLYCYHLFSIVVVQKINAIFHLNPHAAIIFYSELIICLLLSISFAYFSFTYFEKKILAFKSKFITVETR
jgi:peptidoglycan/LPS O-acetylase OafA/YrhL